MFTIKIRTKRNLMFGLFQENFKDKSNKQLNFEIIFLVFIYVFINSRENHVYLTTSSSTKTYKTCLTDARLKNV